MVAAAALTDERSERLAERRRQELLRQIEYVLGDAGAAQELAQVLGERVAVVLQQTVCGSAVCRNAFKHICGIVRQTKTMHTPCCINSAEL